MLQFKKLEFAFSSLIPHILGQGKIIVNSLCNIINQLPVFATRWQYGSYTCFANFTKLKMTKLLTTKQPRKLEKKYTEVLNL